MGNWGTLPAERPACRIARILGRPSTCSHRLIRMGINACAVGCHLHIVIAWHIAVGQVALHQVLDVPSELSRGHLAITHQLPNARVNQGLFFGGVLQTAQVLKDLDRFVGINREPLASKRQPFIHARRVFDAVHLVSAVPEELLLTLCILPSRTTILVLEPALIGATVMPLTLQVGVLNDLKQALPSTAQLSLYRWLSHVWRVNRTGLK